MKLVICRHGKPAERVEKMELTAEAEVGLQKLARRLSEIVQGASEVRLYTSPAARCVVTAGFYCRELGIEAQEEVPGMIEGDWVSKAMQRIDEAGPSDCLVFVTHEPMANTLAREVRFQRPVRGDFPRFDYGVAYVYDFDARTCSKLEQ